MIAATREHSFPALNYSQALVLHWMFTGVVIGMVLLGSLVFAAPSSNGTICLVVIIGILLLGRHLVALALQQPEPVSSVLYGLYYAMPHLEFFDVRDLLVHNRPLIPWWAVGAACLYALAYTATFLGAAWLVFRRKPLSV